MSDRRKIRDALAYDDVLLVPQYSDIESRAEVSLRSALDDNLELRLPIISSPMDTVTGSDMAAALVVLGGLPIVHRYNSPAEQAQTIIDALKKADLISVPLIGAAIGVSGDFESRACMAYDAGARILCVDVAHGHHILVKRALLRLREVFGLDIHLMAGNVATLEGFNALSDWGADSVRCNIGSGSCCTTKVQTGHGIPGLQTILDCAISDRSARIIADGGIRSAGDIVKALGAGADFVMLGSMLAGTNEALGETIATPDGAVSKVYRGMASREAQEDWRGRASSLEGVATSVPCRGPVENIIDLAARGIRSGLSYSGARNIREFQAKAKFVRQTNAGQIESAPHILLGT